MDRIFLITSGDLRLAANQQCEEAQVHLEKLLGEALEKLGVQIQRAHQYDPGKKHGFIDSQKMGIEVFRKIPSDAPLIVAEAVWQYSHHVLAGLYTHKGPILTIANWSGTWPGLVGLLNLNASLTKAGVAYSTLWSEDFTDDFFINGLKMWLKKGKITHDYSHVTPYANAEAPTGTSKIGIRFAKEFLKKKFIMGIFDEGCMGMYNAIIPDELLHQIGVFKERLSQSTLYAEMLTVSDDESSTIFDWLIDRGVQFHFGTDEATELTHHQVIQQCKMYIAAMRIADRFGCATIGIQYQQGLKDLTPASDLVEGILNNVDRPPVYDQETKEVLYEGDALPHFNEVDECAGLDGLMTYHLWKELGFPPENTLHDIRWGRHFSDEDIDAFVWTLEISGAAPPAHFIDGYKSASSERQPPMYFKLGGGTLKGISKPGHVVWSRIYIENKKLYCDIGLAEVVSLPLNEIRQRWRLTTPQWPIMNVVFKGITRDQMMAKHKSNHIQVVYAPDFQSARKGMLIKAAALDELGVQVNFCGALR